MEAARPASLHPPCPPRGAPEHRTSSRPITRTRGVHPGGRRQRPPDPSISPGRKPKVVGFSLACFARLMPMPTGCAGRPCIAGFSALCTLIFKSLDGRRRTGTWRPVVEPCEPGVPPLCRVRPCHRCGCWAISQTLHGTAIGLPKPFQHIPAVLMAVPDWWCLGYVLCIHP